MHTSEVKSYMVSSKTVKNDLYLTAIINTQEKSLQRLQAINNELKIQYSKYHVGSKLYILYTITITHQSIYIKYIKIFIFKLMYRNI